MNIDFRPSFQVLDIGAVKHVVEIAYTLLGDPGFTLHYRDGLQMMTDAGADVDFSKKRVRVQPDLIDKALSSVPPVFHLYTQDRGTHLDLGGTNNYFGTSGSVIYVQDFEHPEIRRKPLTRDFAEHNMVFEACDAFSIQGGPMVVSDVPKEAADTYRLLLCMLFTNKPVIATSFSIESYARMKDLLIAMAGDEKDIARRPAHAFGTTVSSPLAWSELAAFNLTQAARDGIPAKFTSIPVSGGTAPVTLAGTLAQMTAENLSAVILNQTAGPGSALLWGGCPSILEMRYGTTPMTAVESTLMSCANTEIAKYLGVPTGAHAGRANSKRVDSQSGIEASLAVFLHTLSGTNQIGGAGFMEYASTQSLEKLVIDHEICGQARRLVQGIGMSDETLVPDLIREIAGSTQGYMSCAHTLKHFKTEFHFPSSIIDVTNRSQYEKKGAKDSRERAHEAVRKILDDAGPVPMDTEKRSELIRIARDHARMHGMERLPVEDWPF